MLAWRKGAWAGTSQLFAHIWKAAIKERENNCVFLPQRARHKAMGLHCSTAGFDYIVGKKISALPWCSFGCGHRFIWSRLQRGMCEKGSGWDVLVITGEQAENASNVPKQLWLFKVSPWVKQVKCTTSTHLKHSPFRRVQMSACLHPEPKNSRMVEQTAQGSFIFMRRF